MIPREPTKAMLEAGQNVLDECLDEDWDSGTDGESWSRNVTIRSDAAARVWAAMVAAADQEKSVK